MKLVLIRHGQSLANRAKLVTGNTEDVLSSDGVTQVHHTSDFLKRLDVQPDHHFTSQWRRAQQTASLVMPKADFIVDTRLGETNAGQAADLTLPQFLNTWPDFYRDNTNTYPGGESHADLNRRVLSWLKHTRETCRGNVLAVTHAGPIACLLQHTLQIPMERFPALMARNGSISVIEYGDRDDRGTLTTFSLLPESSARQLMGTD